MPPKLSILIPCYNDDCTPLVAALNSQLAAEDSAEWEILVGDDGSTDASILAHNRTINNTNGCRYIEFGVNKGRSAARNALAREAKYDALLYIDCGVEIRKSDFARVYINNVGTANVVYGGYEIYCDATLCKQSLRYKYEKSAEKHNTTEQRQHAPYRSFRSVNFMIERQMMLQTGFNEDMRGYGYEDMALALQLEKAHATIKHIDNSVTYTVTESNETFVRKTQDALVTLTKYHSQLRNHSSLLQLYERICSLHLHPLLCLIYKKAARKIRKNLTGKNPKVWLFQFFKLGEIALAHNK